MRVRPWTMVVACLLASTWGLAALAQTSSNQGTSHEQSGNRTWTSNESGTHGQHQPMQPQTIFLPKQLSDIHVVDQQNQKLGDLDSLILDADTGRIFYGVLSNVSGGKTVAVPWTAMRVEKAGNQNQYHLVINKSPQDMANAPTLTMQDLSEVSNRQWQDSVNRFFGVRTAARPITSSENSESRSTER